MTKSKVKDHTDPDCDGSSEFVVSNHVKKRFHNLPLYSTRLFSPLLFSELLYSQLLYTLSYSTLSHSTLSATLHSQLLYTLTHSILCYSSLLCSPLLSSEILYGNCPLLRELIFKIPPIFWGGVGDTIVEFLRVAMHCDSSSNIPPTLPIGCFTQLTLLSHREFDGPTMLSPLLVVETLTVSLSPAFGWEDIETM